MRAPRHGGRELAGGHRDERRAQRDEHAAGLRSGKKLIKSIIDEEVDHKLLVPTECPLVHVHALDNDESTVDPLRPGRAIHLRCPTQGFAFIPAPQVDKESVTRYLLGYWPSVCPATSGDLSRRCARSASRAPSTTTAYGLKKHDGNCQRIARRPPLSRRDPVDGERDESWSSTGPSAGPTSTWAPRGQWWLLANSP